VDKTGVEIHVDDNVLTIKGNAKYTQAATVLRQEFTLQNYYRQFQLSDEVDQSRISAESKNGVLTITMPKAEKSKPKQIKVKVG
jgi:HSP20 family protein